MYNISLIGKKYEDTILYINDQVHGDTNLCTHVSERFGGMYNFSDAKLSSLNLVYNPVGLKKVFIVSNKKDSTRTSYVDNVIDAELSKNDIDMVNDLSNWLHVCYIDDIEDYKNLSFVEIPFSLDFCTINGRDEYIPIMKKAEVIFDSKERSYLYDGININTPIIFHAPDGVEVVKNKKTVFKKSTTPIANLNVNGAGDLFAAHFIQKYFYSDLKDSTSYAMIQTTKRLLQREHEKI